MKIPRFASTERTGELSYALSVHAARRISG